jgi:hypothetical protein
LLTLKCGAKKTERRKSPCLFVFVLWCSLSTLFLFSPFTSTIIF